MLKKGQEGSRGLNEVQECSKKLMKAQERSRRIKKASEICSLNVGASESLRRHGLFKVSNRKTKDSEPGFLGKKAKLEDKTIYI